MLFVTLTAIYAYRISKEAGLKNWIIFTIFSLFSAYIHYYGLLAIGVINLFLFIYIIKNKREHLKPFIITAITQIALYTPWLIYFVLQLRQVSGGFWISVAFPNTLIDMINIHHIGNLRIGVVEYAIFGVVLLFYGYIGWLVRKNVGAADPCCPGAKSLAPLQSIAIYLSVILAAIIISLIMWSAIIYHRYLLVMTGLLIFFLAYYMSTEKRKYVIIPICLIIVSISTISNIQGILTNYHPSNQEYVYYLTQNLEEDDIIVHRCVGATSIVIRFPDNKHYFYNPGNWGVEEAYRAFGTHFSVRTTLDFLEEYTGRIWIINEANILDYLENVNIISKAEFNMAYNNLNYRIMLIEK
ncbi:MAG: hypothetical protein FWC68_04390 [Oscillospiraceae bacterium]|nr:hypothetical protein [Oscillospiraceae bacterium]